MVAVEVRPYRGADEAQLLALWNLALPLDPISPRTFWRKVILDPNVGEGFLVAEAGGELVGFLLGLVRREPFGAQGLEENNGWMTAFGVHPEWRHHGVASRLLEASLHFFRERGRKRVLISPYVPNYFVPGIDERAYAPAIAFLQKHGFVVTARPLSMDACLVNLTLSDEVKERLARLAAEGYEVVPLQSSQIPEFLSFLARAMPYDWLRHAREILGEVAQGRGTFDQFLLARRGEEIVGYCQFEGGHFGPFGVAEEHQGHGIGTALLAKCLLTMKAHGHHNAWLLWTSDDAARLYGRFGFKESRRFAVMRKEL